MAKHPDQWNIKSQYFWKEGVGSLFLAIFVALTIRWGLFEAYVIPTGSMLPSLLIHDHIFVNKFVYGLRVPFSENWLVKFSEPKRGEIVVFKYPRDMSIFYVKRVIGEPGDKIFFENGTLYVNDQPMEKNVPNPTSVWDFAWLKDQDFQREDFQNSSFNTDKKANYSLFTENLLGKDHSILLRKGETFRYLRPGYSARRLSFHDGR